MLKVPLLYLTELIEAFFQKPFLRRLESKYPKTITFIHNRFASDRFAGLPLTILLVVAGINIALLSELAEHVVNSEATKTLDTKVSAAIIGIRSPGVSSAFYFFTQLGGIYGVTIMTFITSLFFIWKRKINYLVTLLVAILGSTLSVYLLKKYFHRERPLDIAYYTIESTFSFPSGHATSAMALAGVLCYLCVIAVKNKQIRIILICSGMLYIVIMGLSRIYLGVHFLTDVVAGFILGFLWVLVAIGLLEYLTINKVKQGS